MKMKTKTFNLIAYEKYIEFIERIFGKYYSSKVRQNPIKDRILKLYFI